MAPVTGQKALTSLSRDGTATATADSQKALGPLAPSARDIFGRSAPSDRARAERRDRASPLQSARGASSDELPLGRRLPRGNLVRPSASRGRQDRSRTSSLPNRLRCSTLASLGSVRLAPRASASRSRSGSLLAGSLRSSRDSLRSSLEPSFARVARSRGRRLARPRLSLRSSLASLTAHSARSTARAQ